MVLLLQTEGLRKEELIPQGGFYKRHAAYTAYTCLLNKNVFVFTFSPLSLIKRLFHIIVADVDETILQTPTYFQPARNKML